MIYNGETYIQCTKDTSSPNPYFHGKFSTCAYTSTGLVQKLSQKVLKWQHMMCLSIYACMVVWHRDYYRYLPVDNIYKTYIYESLGYLLCHFLKTFHILAGILTYIPSNQPTSLKYMIHWLTYMYKSMHASIHWFENIVTRCYIQSSYSTIQNTFVGTSQCGVSP